MLKTRKVVIVGAGHVGSHVALALIQSGEADDIVLIDILKEKAAAQALDLDDCVSGALCGHDAKNPRRMSQEAANLACSSSVSFSSRISSIPFLPITQGTPAATSF